MVLTLLQESPCSLLSSPSSSFQTPSPGQSAVESRSVPLVNGGYVSELARCKVTWLISRHPGCMQLTPRAPQRQPACGRQHGFSLVVTQPFLELSLAFSLWRSPFLSQDGKPVFLLSRLDFQKVFYLKVTWKKSPFAGGDPLCFQPPVTVWPHLGMQEVILGSMLINTSPCPDRGKKREPATFLPRAHLQWEPFISFCVCF